MLTIKKIEQKHKVRARMVSRVKAVYAKRNKVTDADILAQVERCLKRVERSLCTAQYPLDEIKITTRLPLIKPTAARLRSLGISAKAVKDDATFGPQHHILVNLTPLRRLISD